MEINKRKSIYDPLEKYSPFYGKDDYIEITEWINEEGWDIHVSTKHRIQLFNITRDELDAIIYLTKALEFNKD